MAKFIKRYRVTIKGRNRYFSTFDGAKFFCNDYFDRTGIVLGIEAAT